MNRVLMNHIDRAEINGREKMFNVQLKTGERLCNGKQKDDKDSHKKFFTVIKSHRRQQAANFYKPYTKFCFLQFYFLYSGTMPILVARRWAAMH